MVGRACPVIAALYVDEEKIGFGSVRGIAGQYKQHALAVCPSAI